MKKILFISAALFMTTFISCMKAKLSGDLNWGGYGGITFNNIRFDSAALEYIKIPLSRFFIYQDSATGVFDSVQVNVNEKVSVFGPSTLTTPAFYYERFTTYIVDPLNSLGQPWFSGSASCDSQYKPIPVYINPDIVLINNYNSLPCFWFPFTSSGLSQYSFMPVINFAGKSYTDVHQFSASNGLPVTNTNYQASTFYWVKGIGIIKREIRQFNAVKTSWLFRYGP